MTFSTEIHFFQCLSLRRRPLRLGTQEEGVTIIPRAQEGRQNLEACALRQTVSVGTPRQEARWPMPESFPIMYPDSATYAAISKRSINIGASMPRKSQPSLSS